MVHFSEYYLVIDGHIGFNEVYDRLEKNATSGDDYRKLQMNILLYEPSLNAAWDRLMNSRGEVGRFVNAIKREFKKGEDVSDFRPTFHAAMVKLTDSVQFLENAATIRGREIAEERGQAEKLLHGLLNPFIHASGLS